MQITKVYYQRNFRIGDFQYETIGIGIDLNENEDAKQAMDEAKRLVIEYNAEQNHPTPHIVEGNIPQSLPEIQVEKPFIQVNYNTVIEEINKCESIKDLDEWNIISKGNHDARMAFSSKAAQLLSPKEPTLEQQIRSCKELKVLKVYESMVKKDPILQKAYNDTLSTIELHKL